MKPRAILAGVVLSLTGQGCDIHISQTGGSRSAPEASGADCRGVRQPDSASLEAEIANHLCQNRRESSPVTYGLDVARRHKTFDDRRPDRVAAALNVIDCGKSEGYDKVAVGMCTYYAELVDETSARSAVASLELPDELKSAFVSSTAWGKARVAAFVESFDPRRKHLYVEVPHAVIEKRRAYFNHNAALYAKLDALEAQAKEAHAAQKTPPELVDGFVAVRGEYLTQCGNADCRFDPLVIEVTQELVLLAIGGSDELLARAENHLLREPAAGRHLFAVETGTALYQATAKESRDYGLYEQARRTLDAATLSARFGSPPPIHIDPQSDYVGSDHLPDLTRLLGDAQGSAARWVDAVGVVRAVSDSGKKNERGEPLSLIAFRDNVTTEGIESCYETGKIAGISFDSSGYGRIDYETSCRTIGTKTNVEKIQPVLVPKSEAQSIKGGEVLLALIAPDSRQGLVVQSTAKTKPTYKETGRGAEKTPVLQVRSHRFSR